MTDSGPSGPHPSPRAPGAKLDRIERRKVMALAQDHGKDRKFARAGALQLGRQKQQNGQPETQ